jgi:DNA-directed RNA polymerase sigma subunit (sigma70/sigma32)
MLSKKEREGKLAKLEALKEISVSDKNRLIFKTYYGLEDGISRSFEDTGRIFNITGEGVRLIVRKIDNIIK